MLREHLWGNTATVSQMGGLNLNMYRYSQVPQLRINLEECILFFTNFGVLMEETISKKWKKILTWHLGLTNITLQQWMIFLYVLFCFLSFFSCPLFVRD